MSQRWTTEADRLAHWDAELAALRARAKPTDTAAARVVARMRAERQAAEKPNE